MTTTAPNSDTAINRITIPRDHDPKIDHSNHDHDPGCADGGRT